MNFRRKRRVRIHFKADVDGRSFEGVQVGRKAVGGHYLLLAPKVIEAEGETTSIDVGHFEIPAANVLTVQVLGG